MGPHRGGRRCGLYSSLFRLVMTALVEQLPRALTVMQQSLETQGAYGPFLTGYLISLLTIQFYMCGAPT